MAKAKFPPFIQSALKSFFVRKKRGLPLYRLDLTILGFRKKLVLIQKPIPKKKASVFQTLTRERFKEADCIFWRMTPAQKKTVKEWGKEMEAKYRLGLKPYHYFMSGMLTNHIPLLLKKYFCLDLGNEEVIETDTDIIVTCELIDTDKLTDEYIENFYERISRRY